MTLRDSLTKCRIVILSQTLWAHFRAATCLSQQILDGKSSFNSLDPFGGTPLWLEPSKTVIGGANSMTEAKYRVKTTRTVTTTEITIERDESSVPGQLAHNVDAATSAPQTGA